MPEIDFKTIKNKDNREFSYTLPGASAATAGNYAEFKNIISACEIIDDVAISFDVKGSDGSAVTLQIEKLADLQAPGAGTVLLAAAVSLKGTARTVVFADLTATKANRKFKRGDRLALLLTGTPTAISNLTIDYRLKPLGKGHYNQ